jgi:hypothetical protein
MVVEWWRKKKWLWWWSGESHVREKEREERN